MPVIPSITIPKGSKSALTMLAKMDALTFKALLDGVEGTPPHLVLPKFAEAVVSASAKLKKPIFTEIIRELFMIHSIANRLNLDAEQAGNLVAEAKVEGEAKSSWNREEQKALNKRVASLLSRRGLVLTAKTASVINAHERIYLSAKIHSDIRPVFDGKADEICAATTIHTLDIHFMKDDEHCDFYVAMDDSDLLALKAVIDRAETKGTRLKSLISERNKIPYLLP